MRRSGAALGALGLVSLISMTSGAATAAPLVASEVPVSATDLRVAPVASNSPMLEADPTDARFVVAAHRHDAPDFGCALQLSGDGGRGWIPANPVPKLPEDVERCYAPEVAFDRNGTLYYLFAGLRGSGNEPFGIYLTSSSDRGRTFREPWKVLGEENYSTRMAIDRSEGKAGRIHLVWLHSSLDAPVGGLPPVHNPILAAHSDDGGRTFTEPIEISDHRRERVVAPALALGPDGTVTVLYYDLKEDAVDYRGLDGPTWAGTWELVMTRSTDGGRRFAPGVKVDEIVPPGRVMLIFTMPPPSIAVDGDRIYAGWWDARHGDPDVFVAASEDGGRTWQPAKRVNDTAQGDGRDQYLIRLSVAPGGRLDAVFLDRRNDETNLRNDVYYTYSTDRGGAFAPNVKITSDSSDTRIGQEYEVRSAAGLVEFGSRLGLLSTNGSVLAAWPDTRYSALGTRQQDIMAAQIRLPDQGDGGGGGSVPWVPIVAGVVFVVGLVAIFLMRGTRKDTETPIVEPQ